MNLETAEEDANDMLDELERYNGITHCKILSWSDICTANPSKLIEKCFLDLRTYSQIKKILDNSSQNKKIYLANKKFLVPSIRMFIF